MGRLGQHRMARRWTRAASRNRTSLFRVHVRIHVFAVRALPLQTGLPVHPTQKVRLLALRCNIETAGFTLYSRMTPLRKAVGDSGAVRHCGSASGKARAVVVRGCTHDQVSYRTHGFRRFVPQKFLNYTCGVRTTSIHYVNADQLRAAGRLVRMGLREGRRQHPEAWRFLSHGLRNLLRPVCSDSRCQRPS